MASIGPKEAARRALREKELATPPDAPEPEIAPVASSTPRFDRLAYQRTYMRAYRARKKEQSIV